MTWRVAHSLEKLRSQVNALHPSRAKTDDGTIGDESHSSRLSDHNPNPSGVVCALDLTHDPKGGFDSYAFAEMLRNNRDHRIQYVISNGRIFSSSVSPWSWRPYHGANPHDRHVHISVIQSAKLYDDPADWNLSSPMAESCGRV